jgi:large subunit ribosomal protein L17
VRGFSSTTAETQGAVRAVSHRVKKVYGEHQHGRITTTLTRAKAARPVAEKMITFGKRDTLQSRRQAAAYIMTPAVTKKLFSEIAPKFADRAGGYTRIISAGNRVGDGAKVAILELVGYEFKKKDKKEKEKAKKEEPVEAAS